MSSFGEYEVYIAGETLLLSDFLQTIGKAINQEKSDQIILDGRIMVNEKLCLRQRTQLTHGDTVQVSQQKYTLKKIISLRPEVEILQWQVSLL